MRRLGVVVRDPCADGPPCMIEPEEQAFVQKFVAHPAVEGLDGAILHRLARCDVMPLDAVVFRPGEDRVRGQLGAVVARRNSQPNRRQGFWCAAAGTELRDSEQEFADHLAGAPPNPCRSAGDAQPDLHRSPSCCGGTYRVPNIVGLRLSAPDAGAVEIILDGRSVGFAGEDGVMARGLSLNRQNIIDRQQPG